MNLLNYHLWADNRLIDLINNIDDTKWSHSLDNNKSSIKSKTIHLIAANYLWQERLDGKSHVLSEFQDEISKLTKSELLDLWREYNSKLKNHFENRNEKRSVQYQNSRGIKYTNTEEEIYNQVFLHAIAHRSQLNLCFRINNIEPINVDYIVYLRSLR